MPPGDAPVLRHSAPHHRRGNRPDPNSGLRLGVERRSDPGRGSEGRLLPAAAVCAARRSGSQELCPAQPIRGQIPGVPRIPPPPAPIPPGQPPPTHPATPRPGCPPPSRSHSRRLNFFLSSTNLPEKIVLRGSEDRPEESRGNAEGVSRGGGEEGEDFKVNLKTACKLLGCSRNAGLPGGFPQPPRSPPRCAPQNARGLPGRGDRTDAPPSLPYLVETRSRQRPRLNPVSYSNLYTCQRPEVTGSVNQCHPNIDWIQVNSVQKGSLNTNHHRSVKAGNKAGTPFCDHHPSEGPSPAPQNRVLYLKRAV